MTFRHVDAFDFFLIGPILGSRAYSALRLVLAVAWCPRYLEQVLKKPPLTPRAGFLKKNNLVCCCA
jgi:hypothetical protein